MNYYQRTVTIKQSENSSEDDDTIETINNKTNENNQKETKEEQTQNEIKRKTIKDEDEKNESISNSEDFEEYKKKMKQKSKKGVFQRIYKCLVVDVINRILFSCINCCFEMICCDDDCIDKMDCINIESCNEDGIFDCGCDDDDCC